MGDARDPRARGDLAETPFAHLVLYLQRESATGTLCIEQRGIEVKLRVRGGRIIAAKPVERGASLQQGLLPLCALAQAPYSFWDDDLLEGASGVVTGTVDPSTFVAESLRQHTRDDVVARVLERYHGMAFQLAPDVDLRRFGLRPREISVVETLIARPCDEETLVERAASSPTEVRRLLYMLVIQKLVQVEPLGPTSSSGAHQSASISPGWHATPPGASNVPPRRVSSSMPAAVSTRPSGAPRGSLRPAASVPAWQQLASRRAASRSQVPLDRIPSAAPPPAELLDVAGKLRRIEQLCDAQAYDAALRLADEVVAEDATVAEHHAMRAWVMLHQWTGSRLSHTLAESVTRAARLDPDNVRALYVKGSILKRTGKPREARRYFARVLELDPKHVDAERELRLARLRSDK